MQQVRYVCDKCGWAFRRVTNMDQPDTFPCTHSNCDGVMHKSIEVEP